MTATMQKPRCLGYVPDQTKDGPLCAMCGEPAQVHIPRESSLEWHPTAKLPQYKSRRGSGL